MSKLTVAIDLFVDSTNDRRGFITRALTQGFTPAAASTYWQVLYTTSSPRIKCLVVQARRNWYKTFSA